MEILNLEINKDIHTREEIRMLFNFNDSKNMENWQQTKEIVLNMSQCTFISRSPAHELVKQIENLQNNYKIKVILKNQQHEVEKMITVIKQSVNQTKTMSKSYNIIQYSDNNEFYNMIEKW